MAQNTEYFGFYGISQLHYDITSTLRMGARILGWKQNAHCNVGNGDEYSLLFWKIGIKNCERKIWCIMETYTIYCILFCNVQLQVYSSITMTLICFYVVYDSANRSDTRIILCIIFKLWLGKGLFWTMNRNLSKGYFIRMENMSNFYIHVRQKLDKVNYSKLYAVCVIGFAILNFFLVLMTFLV